MIPESVPTPDRLRQAAAELFAERGFAGTSMADLAERVGVAKASLYNYYPSKEDLLFDLLRRGLEAWLTCCVGALDLGGSCEERLRRLVEEALRFTSEHRDAVALFRLAAIQIGGELGDRVCFEVRAMHSVLRSRVLGEFVGAIERGAIAPADPEDLAAFLRAFVTGLQFQKMACAGEQEFADERLPALWAIFWRGGRGEAMEVTG